MNEPKPRKTHYHSTVNRRSFIKMLGFGAGAVGLDATSGFATSFKDLDEMKSSPLAHRNLPFWVKEVDEPTVKIDWDNMQIFPSPSSTLFNPASWTDKSE